jgi:hypothetical protein
MDLMDLNAVLTALCAALLLGGASGYAAAQSDGVKDAFKKTERGFGELLQGMGQELKKVQKKATKTDSAKKDK